ncbi:MAG TPA: MBL fold metallo-hydrolase [Myxococcaceae bacterium]|nr:MBL fold metallo-hydrolase [Myxococcaceae bacterium]
MTTLQFLGAAGTVTGSKYLVQHDGRRILIDCGLFQGLKELRLRNWSPLPVDPKSIEAVALTHAHIDHIGSLPRLVKEGFDGPVFSTSATRALAGLLLPDSAHLQEEEARYANEAGSTKHDPALPLYTVEDACAALRHFETFEYGRRREILPGITLTFARAGHILGSAICTLELAGSRQRIVFSGDLGRYDAPILRDPEPVEYATTLLVESTYGDRTHGAVKAIDALASAVSDAVVRKGMIVIPSFAVGRTQEILYDLRALEEADRIPTLDVFVDSPMACDATPIYLAHPEDHDLDMTALLERGISPLATRRTHFVTSVEDSKKLNDRAGPAIIISASGMATGGRILHHLKHRLPDPKNTILFVGYQAEGTRGRRLLAGEKEIRIYGEMVKVSARVAAVSGFSAHGDWRELMRWMSGFRAPPKQTFLVHGEAPALEALRQRVAQNGWPVRVPPHLETVQLDD